MLKLGDLGAHLIGLMFLLSVAGKTRLHRMPSSSGVWTYGPFPEGFNENSTFQNRESFYCCVLSSQRVVRSPRERETLVSQKLDSSSQNLRDHPDPPKTTGELINIPEARNKNSTPRNQNWRDLLRLNLLPRWCNRAVVQSPPAKHTLVRIPTSKSQLPWTTTVILNLW